jgi:prepilin-type N-terminal cleavage/methylation domain-containing protein
MRSAIAAQRGLTLIEVIVFIVIMGISAVALLSMYRAVMPRGSTPAQITVATQLAQERMELLLGQRAIYGYSTAVLTDPCVSGTPPAICTNQYTPSGLYSIVVTGVNPAVPWGGYGTDSYRMLGVTVLGPGGGQLASLSALIGNY